jgi:hypothetical protein
MEQKDYLLREIEKIGVVISAILQKIFGGTVDLSVTPEKQIEYAEVMLLTEMNFELDKFLNLSPEKSNEYICSFEGFSVENIELLAECLYHIGFNDECDNSKKHLEKSLQLYDLCNLKSKTFSWERETKIKAITNALQD